MSVLLNGVTLLVKTYEITKTGKVGTYTIPNASRSVLIPLGGSNLSFSVQTQTIADTDMETLSAILNSNAAVQFNDIELNTYFCYINNYKTDFVAGQTGYYNIDLQMTAINQ